MVRRCDQAGFEVEVAAAPDHPPVDRGGPPVRAAPELSREVMNTAECREDLAVCGKA